MAAPVIAAVVVCLVASSAAAWLSYKVGFRRGYRRGVMDGNPLMPLRRAVQTAQRLAAARSRALVDRVTEEAETITREAST